MTKTTWIQKTDISALFLGKFSRNKAFIRGCKITVAILALICFAGFNTGTRVKYTQDNLSKMRTRLDSFFGELELHNKIMGQITISENGNKIYQNTTGYADLDKQIKPTDSSMYEIGSLTKTFTAVMILQLAEEKKLTLDEKLSDYMPLIPNAAKIKIRHLLNHTSGLVDQYPIYIVKDARHNEMTWTSSQKPGFTTGKTYRYANINYGLLGLIIEKITHADFEDQLQKRICAKAGLKNTWFAHHTSEYLRITKGYKKKKGRWISGTGNRLDAFSAGGIVSCTADLNQFLESLNQIKLLSDSMYLVLMNSGKQGYGYGIMPMPFYQKTGFGHTGDIGDFHSAMVSFPGDHLCVSVCFNGLDYSLNGIFKTVLRIYYGI